MYHTFGKTSDLCVAPVTGLLWGSERRRDVTRRVQPCWLVTSASCRSIQPASRCDGTMTRSTFNLSYSAVPAITELLYGRFQVKAKQCNQMLSFLLLLLLACTSSSFFFFLVRFLFLVFQISENISFLRRGYRFLFVCFVSHFLF